MQWLRRPRIAEIQTARYDNVFGQCGKESSFVDANNPVNNGPPNETQQQALRLVDANANRAAEGLRVIEDYARLVSQDRYLSEKIKHLRHGLAEALSGVDRKERLASRNTETDAGTDVTTAGELSRADLESIIPAAAERVTQALRGLEEYAKFLTSCVAEKFKSLRYAAYDTLAEAELRLSRHPAIVPAHLYLLVDCQLPIERFCAEIKQLAQAGVDWFQIRDKRADGAVLLQYTKGAIASLCDTPAKVLVNDRVDIALATGAFGVHLGQEDLPLADARRISGGRLCIGISTHNTEQAVEAEQGGADYIGCGPTFPSATKTFDSFAGVSFLRDVAKQVSLPRFAIGGIQPDNLNEVVSAGFSRIAVTAAIQAADQPTKAAAALKRVLVSSAPHASCVADP